MVGQIGRKRHKKKNIFYEPTQGISPLTLIGKHPSEEFEILWEPVGEGTCTPLKQIVIVGSDGTLRLPYRPGALTVEKIKRQMAKQNIGKPQQALYVSFDPTETKEMETLCSSILPDAKDKDLPLPADGVAMEGEMLAPVSAGYLRAIAKIGFHFLLQYFSRFTGLEPEFEAIKRFIYLGEGHNRVAPTHEQFVLALRTGVLKRWGHLLSAQADEHGIEARMQFFAGPSVQPIIWRVDIGRNPYIYRESVGQACLYYETLSGEYQGERSDMTPTGVALNE
jgi:hypothetical protein